MQKKQLRIWTSVWGEKHIDWFERFCVSSLMQPKNAAALENATWVINTRGPDRERIEKIIRGSGIKVRPEIEFCVFGPEFDQNPHSAGSFINQALILEIQRCISFNCQNLIAPPDTIFGDGTIPNLIEIADQRDVVVMAAHVRVLPDIYFPYSQVNSVSNAQLTKMAFENLHATWKEAEHGLPMINSYIGGVFWKYVSEDLLAVQHRLPTPYLINWTPEDLVFFRNQLHWGVLDHSWPHECLVHTERQRVVGSSDAAFMVEITEPTQNVPPAEHYRHDEPDLFWKNLKHNKQNRMYSIIFRREN